MDKSIKKAINKLSYETTETVLKFVTPDTISVEDATNFATAAVAVELIKFFAEYEIQVSDIAKEIPRYEIDAAIIDWQLFSKK